MSKQLWLFVAALACAGALALVPAAGSSPTVSTYDVQTYILLNNDTLSCNSTDSVTVTAEIPFNGVRLFYIHVVADSVDTVLTPTIQLKLPGSSTWQPPSGSTVFAGTYSLSVLFVPVAGYQIASWYYELQTSGPLVPSPVTTIRFRLKGNNTGMNGGAGATNRKRPTHRQTWVLQVYR